MEFVPPLVGKDLDQWQASIPRPTPPQLYGVPNQSFQGMDLGQSSTQPYSPIPAVMGLPQRIQDLTGRDALLGRQIQGVRGQITDALGQYQQDVSQPVEPFQLPTQHEIDPKSAKLGALAAILAVLGGARGQVANQAYGGFLGGMKQNADSATQRDTQQAQYDYQARQQSRQQKLQGELAGVQKFQGVLEGLNADFNKNESQISQLTYQDEQAKNRAEANRIAAAGVNQRAEAAKATDRRMRDIADAKDPAEQLRRSIKAAKDESLDPDSPYYGRYDDALKIFTADQNYKMAAAANLQSVRDERSKTLGLKLEAMQKANEMKGLDIQKLTKDLENYDDDRALKVAKTLAEIDDMHFRQQHYGDTFDSKVIDDEAKQLEEEEKNFQDFLKEKDEKIADLDEKIAAQDPVKAKDYVDELKRLRDIQAQAKDDALSSVSRAILERRQKIRDMREALAARAKAAVPPKPSTGARKRVAPAVPDMSRLVPAPTVSGKIGG